MFKVFYSRKLSPPDPRSDDSVSPSHGSRLEDVCDLGVDGLVVAGPGTVGTVARVVIVVVLADVYGTKSAWEELRQPFIDHDVLVSGDGELTSSVEQPLVFLRELRGLANIMQSPSPVLVDPEP